MSSKNKLYAILVGINNYQHVGDLRGCVADVGKMKAYLEKPFVQAGFQQSPELHILTDEEEVKPTKKNIYAAFKTVSERAKKDDVIFFYFSGHGYREKTSLGSFQEDEFDGNIAALVCMESYPFIGNRPMAPGISDKELRYLVHDLDIKTGGATIITVFDCCHSGENTRSLQANSDLGTNTRRIQRNPLDERPVDTYDFRADTSRIMTDVQAGKNLQTILPEGRHIQLAACKEVEEALEEPKAGTVRSGVFTTALLNVLESVNGNISYQNLYTRVLNMMPTLNQSLHAQTPQFYFKMGDPKERYFTFLSHQPTDKALICAVVRGGGEDTSQEWRITAGALQGVPIDPSKRSFQSLEVRSKKSPSKKYTIKIKQVLAGHSTIEFIGEEPPTEKENFDHTLFTKVPNIGAEPLKVSISVDDKTEAKNVKLLKEGLEKILDEAEVKLFELVGDEEAQYSLRIEDSVCLITKPNVHDKPLVKGVGIADIDEKFLPESITTINEHLKQISQWSYLQMLEHSENHDLSSFTDKQKTMFPVELRMFVYDEEAQKEHRVFPDKNKQFSFELSEAKPYRWFRLELVNHSKDDYHCSLLYLTNTFGVIDNMMVSNQLLLGPSQGILSSRGLEEFNGKKYIKMTLENNSYIKDFNWDGLSYFFKLIVSKAPFDVSTLTMKSLPKPEKEEPKDVRKALTTRGGDDLFMFEPVAPKIQWEVHTFELFVLNPYPRVIA